MNIDALVIREFQIGVVYNFWEWGSKNENEVRRFDAYQIQPKIF